MNTENFEKLMTDQPAKWADGLHLKSVREITSNDDQINLTLFRAQKEKIREEIEEKQEPIPKNVSNAIHKYVKDERAKKTSERGIRRGVKRKWNIFVV